MDKKSDLRVLKTQKVLWESMVELSLKKGYKNISVQDLCKHSQINRSTFYRHFEGKEDLLLRKSDELLFTIAKEAKNVQEVAKSGDYSEFELFLQFIEEHASFFKVMFSTEGEPLFVERIYTYLYDVTEMRLKQWNLDLDKSPVPLDLLLSYIAGAHLSMLKWWVNSENPCTIKELTSYNVQLFTHDPLSLLGLDLKSIMKN